MFNKAKRMIACILILCFCLPIVSCGDNETRSGDASVVLPESLGGGESIDESFDENVESAFEESFEETSEESSEESSETSSEDE